MITRFKSSGFVTLAVFALLLAIGVHQRWLARAREAELALVQASLGRSNTQAKILENQITARSRVSTAVERRPSRAAGPIVAFPNARVAAMYANRPDLTKAIYLPLIRKHFSAFCDAARLSRTEIDAFESMLAQAGPVLEFGLLANSEVFSDGGDLEAAARAEAEQARELSHSVRDLLGDAAGEKFAEALRARGARNIVERVAIDTFHTESPLTGAQGAQLTQLLLEARTGHPEDPSRAETLDWTMIMQRAPGFLPPVQLRTLEAMRAKAAFDREYRRITGFAAGERLPSPEP